MKKIFLTYGIVWMLILVMIVGTSSFALADVETNTEVVSSADKMLISINPNASIEDVKSFVDSENLDIESFNAEFNVNGETITCGYVINHKDDFLTLWDDFTEKQVALLSEAMDVNADNEEMIRGLSTLLNAFEQDEAKVSSVVCRNVEIDSVENLSIVDGVLSIPDYNETLDLSENSISAISQNETVYSTTDTVAANTWVPTTGTAYAWPSGEYSGATYLQLDYRWDSASRMTALTGNAKSTLEGEIVFYNYDGSAIATDWYNQTYTTNQPSPYLDTQFLDSSNEINFTIGCSYASSMSSGKLYYWYAYGNRTDSNACKAKVSFQRGHRLIAENFGDTWNVFGDQTEVVVSFSEWNTGTSASKSF